MSKINNILFFLNAKNLILISSILLFISCGNNNQNNNKMLANAGNDIFIVSPSIVEINGSKSFSPNHNLQYSWKLYSKPKTSKATLSNKNISNPTLLIDVDGNYLLELTVSDGKKVLKDNIQVTLNSLCKISLDPKFNISVYKEVFQPQIKGLKNDINGTFVYFNRIKNATNYKLSIRTKNKEFENLDIENKVIFQFKNDNSVKDVYYQPHSYMSDAMVLRSSQFNIGDKVYVSLKAFDGRNNLITSSKEISFILGKSYRKNALKMYFTNASINDKVNLSWCPSNNDGKYILHYGSSFDNLDKTIEIKDLLDFKTSIEYKDKENAQYFALSNNGFFSNTINTMPLSDANKINFAISKVTFNQSVQVDMDNNINNTPIIANKVGVLRVFTTIKNGFSSYKVRVKLSGRNDGKELTPIIKTVILHNNDFKHTDSTNKPITFHINNQDWLKVGTKFYIEIDSNNRVEESNENDNRYPKELYKSFGFQNVHKMKVNLIPINAIDGYVNIPTSYIYEVQESLESMYPLNTVEISIDKPLNLMYNTINTGAKLLNVLDNVIKYKDEKIINDDANKDVYYVGIVDNLKFRNITGIGEINDNETVSLASLVKINGMSKYSFAKTIAHEIGHNHSLKHIDSSNERYCKTPTRTDNNYPYNKANKKYGRIGKTSYANYRNAFYSKNIYHDIMGYCPKKIWISDYSYNKIYNFERKLDKLYSRDIKRSIDNNPLINGRVIMGRVNNNVWKITKNYISKSRKNTSKTKTNFYLKVILDDNTIIKIPLYLIGISHMKAKIFKVFIPFVKNIKSISVVDILSANQAFNIMDFF